MRGGFRVRFVPGEVRTDAVTQKLEQGTPGRHAGGKDTRCAFDGGYHGNGCIVP